MAHNRAHSNPNRNPSPAREERVGNVKEKEGARPVGPVAATIAALAAVVSPPSRKREPAGGAGLGSARLRAALGESLASVATAAPAKILPLRPPEEAEPVVVEEEPTVSPRTLRGRTKREWEETLEDDLEFFRRLLKGEERPPAVDERCGRHDDCGRRCAHTVIMVGGEPRIMTLCRAGQNAFRQAEEEWNASRGRQGRARAFYPRQEGETSLTALAEAREWVAYLGERDRIRRQVQEARPAKQAGGGQQQVGTVRSLPQGQERMGQGRVDQYDTRFWHGLDAIYQRVRGTDAPRPRRNGNNQSRLAPSPYLIRVVRWEARPSAPPAESQTTQPVARDFFARLQRAEAGQRAVAKAERRAREQTRQAARRAKLARGVPAAERALRSAASRKGWQRRRGELPATQIRLEDLATRPSRGRRSRAKEGRKPTRRGPYWPTPPRTPRRRPDQPGQAFIAGPTGETAERLRRRLLAQMGCTLEVARGAAIAGTGAPKEK